MVERTAPERVSRPTSSPSAPTTGASLRRAARRRSKASRESMPAGRVSSSVVMTSRTWVKRSTPETSSRSTMPMGRLVSGSTTTAAPCERLGMRPSVYPQVWCGLTVTGVS
ncbi:MAG: hypothetical protein Q605_AUC00713G0002 [Actinomyces urogenitalis DORA_12]|uniref:Uncharacterized protein n=1 Tax=Actinomyces urogenitalis DORA_12 TaxID=1403939 RepID=W1VE98_9ACTO|nr:MAG: hypothetical protein Q605_AUC00713G0002 [Actinomyces urogenitalis DORA_12]